MMKITKPKAIAIVAPKGSLSLDSGRDVQKLSKVSMIGGLLGPL